MSVRTRYRAGVLVTTTLGLLLTTSPALASLSGEVSNVAHRGASLKAPENTLSAMSQAVADRADLVGIDVALTADGVPVVIHDDTLARTTDVETAFPGRKPWWVDDFTLAEIRSLDAGTWRAAAYSGEQVPTLKRVLRELVDSPTGMLLEIKRPDIYGGPEGIGTTVMDTVLDEWPDAGVPDSRRLILQSFDKEFLRQMHDLYPTVPIGLIGRADAGHMQDVRFVNDVNARADTLTQEYVDAAHSLGVRVGSFTVDSESWMNDLIALGVDGITTNRPDVLRDVLAAQGRVYRAERWARTVTATPGWAMKVPRSALPGSRVPVTATLSTGDGSPSRWQWATVQRRVNGSWRTVQRRATDSRGRFRTTVAMSRSLRVRVTTSPDADYPVARSVAQRVEVQKVPSVLSLSGERTIRRDDPARLRARWRTEDGRPLTGRTTLWARRADGTWRAVRDVRVEDGVGTLRVWPRSDTTYELRSGSRWWLTRDSDRHRVAVTLQR